jgi:hypothetical protein
MKGDNRIGERTRLGVPARPPRQTWRVRQALLRLAHSVLAEAHDEWPVADTRYLSEGSMALLDTRLAPRRR